MSRSAIISNIRTTLETLYTSEKIIDAEVSTKDVGQTHHDGILVAVNQTIFNNQDQGQGGLYNNILEIDLVIFQPETVTPLTTILTKEDAVITALMVDPSRGSNASDTVIKTSTASNIIERYQQFGEISTVLRVNVEYGQSY